MPTGVVVARGAMEAMISAGAPNSQTMPTALTMAVTAPASRAQARGLARRRIVARCAQIGTANPTTAGPSRKPSTCVASA